MANVPLTVTLKISLQGLNYHFLSLTRQVVLPYQPGDGPNDFAVPLTQMSWLTTRTLLFTSGPSTVAVRFGASRTSKSQY